MGEGRFGNRVWVFPQGAGNSQCQCIVASKHFFIFPLENIARMETSAIVSTQVCILGRHDDVRTLRREGKCGPLEGTRGRAHPSRGRVALLSALSRNSVEATPGPNFWTLIGTIRACHYRGNQVG